MTSGTVADESVQFYTEEHYSDIVKQFLDKVFHRLVNLPIFASETLLTL